MKGRGGEVAIVSPLFSFIAHFFTYLTREMSSKEGHFALGHHCSALECLTSLLQTNLLDSIIVGHFAGQRKEVNGLSKRSQNRQ